MVPAPSKKGTTVKSAKKVQSAPFGALKTRKTQKPYYFESTPRNFGIGNVQPKRDLTRFVRWPKYILLQRQRRLLWKRLKVPPTINQFAYPIDANTTKQLLKLLKKYKPETRIEKKQRLLKESQARMAKETAEGTTASQGKPPIEKKKKPFLLKYGLNHVTDLIELKKAKLVIIAHDVDPIDLVAWMPTLCRKKDVPYCIVRSKAALGRLVHKKTASCVVIDNVRDEDAATLNTLSNIFVAQFNDNVEMRRRWGN